MPHASRRVGSGRQTTLYPNKHVETLRLICPGRGFDSRRLHHFLIFEDRENKIIRLAAEPVKSNNQRVRKGMLAGLAAVGLLAGCVKSPTGYSQLILFSPENEIAKAHKLYAS